MLDGKGDGLPDSNYVKVLSGKLLASPAPGVSIATARRRSGAAADEPNTRSPLTGDAGANASAIDALAASGELTSSLRVERKHAH